AEAGKLFGIAAAVVAPVPVSRGAETMVLPNVRLVGVFAAEPGHSGFAVMKLDDKRQISVTAGQDVQPGIRLLEIHPGYVVLEQKGVKQRVNLEGNRNDAPGKPDPAAFSPPAAANPASVVRYPASATTRPAAAANSTSSNTSRPGGLRRWED
ncbi:MAG: hypothetical protein OEV35_08850, partial [Gallionellaceae bacterium]|nr:hypothetical protein [Gallionellaceae bacterium]